MENWIETWCLTCINININYVVIHSPFYFEDRQNGIHMTNILLSCRLKVGLIDFIYLIWTCETYFFFLIYVIA